MNVEDAIENNQRIFSEYGPGLRYGYTPYIIARRPGEVLLGGLGGMGVGTMWGPECERHKDYPGYDDAPFFE